MSREQLVTAMRRNLAHSKNGTVPLDDGIVRVPAKNYYDAERWQLETDRIFRRLPLVLGFSCELREPNSYKALEAMGVPILLTRGDDGVLRSFVNMCSHRGAMVVEEGSGTGRRFSCPYQYHTHTGGNRSATAMGPMVVVPMATLTLSVWVRIAVTAYLGFLPARG